MNGIATCTSVTTALASNDRLSLPETFLIPAQAASLQSIAEIRYNLKCGDPHSPKTLPGIITTPSGLRIRFDLFAATHLTEVDLGSTRPGDAFRIELVSTQTTCDLQNASLTIKNAGQDGAPLESLVRAHSPFIVLRADQYSHRYTDLPVALGFSLKPTSRKTVVIKYTAFFTDEDTVTSPTDTDAQMGRYGRRTDIEWIYEVEVDPRTGTAFGRYYQGDILLGIGHLTKSFHGEFLANSSHPILYNIHRHNVFDDSPRGYQVGKPLEGYALVPKIEIPYPLAREDLMWDEPWTFLASDAELGAERKLSGVSSDSLFIRVQGSLQGEIVAEARFSDGAHFFSGHGQGTLDRLGEDLWGKTAYTAIAVGQDRLRAMRDGKLHGMIRLISNPASSEPARLDLEAINFRWLEAAADDLIARDFDGIRCQRELGIVCRF